MVWRDETRHRWTTAHGLSISKAVVVGLSIGLGSTRPGALAVEITAAAQVLADTTDGMLNEVDSQTNLYRQSQLSTAHSHAFRTNGDLSG